MASPAKVVPTAPETLPADFSGWDSEDHQGTLGTGSSDIKEVPVSSASPEPSAQPPAQRASAHPTIGPTVEWPNNPPSLTPAAAFAEAEAFLQTFRPKYMDPEELNPWNTPNKWSRVISKPTNKMIWAAVSVVSVLLLAALIALVYPRLTGKAAMSKQQAAPLTAQVTKIKPGSTAASSKPSASQPLVPAQTDSDAQAPDDQNADADSQDAPQVQSEMMSSQLTAPTRIPQAIKTAPAADTPPPAGFGAAGMESLNGGASGAMGNVFNGQARPKVKVESPKFVNVSAGVAVGLLIQKTTPIYPPIAKTARVSGTVVLQAIISKTGTIDDVQVVSGPEMLRQAAITAVRNWRYRPYMLDNQPISVQTTVNVIFSL
jgi:TonB family protein